MTNDEKEHLHFKVQAMITQGYSRADVVKTMMKFGYKAPTIRKYYKALAGEWEGFREVTLTSPANSENVDGAVVTPFRSEDEYRLPDDDEMDMSTARCFALAKIDGKSVRLQKRKVEGRPEDKPCYHLPEQLKGKDIPFYIEFNYRLKQLAGEQ